MIKLILIPMLLGICACKPHSTDTNLRIGSRERIKQVKRERFPVEMSYPFIKDKDDRREGE